MLNKPLLLAIDVGNTNITVGLFERKRLIQCWRLSTGQEKTADEHGVMFKELLASAHIRPERLRQILLASVVPKATKRLIETLQCLCPKAALQIVGQDLEVPIANRYRDPKQVGQDRLVNAYAASKRFGAPCLVVDFGTAITFDVVSGKGEYQGGIIVPGIEVAVEALSSRAAMLPHIELAPPSELIGRDTVTSMRSGTFYGFAALCDGIVARIRKEPDLRRAPVILTGGQAAMISTFILTPHHLEPFLTLDGLVALSSHRIKQ